MLCRHGGPRTIVSIMTTTSPGWYDDGTGAMRWWDGATWTENVAERPAERPFEQPTAATVPLQPAERAFPAPVPRYSLPAGDVPAQRLSPDAAFSPPPEPRKSGVWFVWVVLGLIVVGVIVALALLTPLLLSAFPTGGGPADASSREPSSEPSSEPSVAEPSGEPVDGPPSAADQQAAVDTIQRFSDAWIAGDCEGYFATTTEAFREEIILIPDCETFDADTRAFVGLYDDYRMTIGDVEVVGSAVAVSATESYTSRYDENGNETDVVTTYEDGYEYFVVRVNGDWVIDDFFAE